MTYFLSILAALAIPYALITWADRKIVARRNEQRLRDRTRQVIASAARKRAAS